METQIEIAINQLYKGQDEASFFKIPTSKSEIDDGWDVETEIAVILDGHGHNFFMDEFRKLDLPSHFLNENPIESIQNIIDQQQRNNNISYEIAAKSGSTISFVTVKKNLKKGIYRVHCEWLGDSPIYIYKNRNLVFQSEIHRASKIGELEQLRKMDVLSGKQETVNMTTFQIVDKNTIEDVLKLYICLRGNYCLECTRSLGHKRLVRLDPQIYDCDFLIKDSIRIVLCTDGVSDIVNLQKIKEDSDLFANASASEIVKYAENRWNQEWNIKIWDKNTKSYKMSIEKFDSNERDDCACITWEL